MRTLSKNEIEEIFLSEIQNGNMEGVTPYYAGFINDFMLYNDIFRYIVLKTPVHFQGDEDSNNWIRIHVEMGLMGVKKQNIVNWIKNQTSGPFSYINPAFYKTDYSDFILSKIPEGSIIGGWIGVNPVIIQGKQEW